MTQYITAVWKAIAHPNVNWFQVLSQADAQAQKVQQYYAAHKTEIKTACAAAVVKIAAEATTGSFSVVTPIVYAGATLAVGHGMQYLPAFGSKAYQMVPTAKLRAAKATAAIRQAIDSKNFKELARWKKSISLLSPADRDYCADKIFGYSLVEMPDKDDYLILLHFSLAEAAAKATPMIRQALDGNDFRKLALLEEFIPFLKKDDREYCINKILGYSTDEMKDAEKWDYLVLLRLTPAEIAAKATIALGLELAGNPSRSAHVLLMKIDPKVLTPGDFKSAVIYTARTGNWALLQHLMSREIPAPVKNEALSVLSARESTDTRNIILALLHPSLERVVKGAVLFFLAKKIIQDNKPDNINDLQNPSLAGAKFEINPVQLKVLIQKACEQGRVEIVRKFASAVTFDEQHRAAILAMTPQGEASLEIARLLKTERATIF